MRIAGHTSPATSTLEDECWELLTPLIEPTFCNVAETRQPHGCWSYEVPDHRSYAIDIHFANVYRPESPFRDHWKDLVSTLLKLIEEAVAGHRGLTSIQCDSWLNQFPPFASLFPPAWHASLILHNDYLATNGWWGQYKDERGAFHKGRADQFRQTGTHPYSAGLCECDIAQVVKHLRGQ